MREARTYDARGTREDMETRHKATPFAAFNDLPKLEVLSTSRCLESCFLEHDPPNFAATCCLPSDVRKLESVA